jgi:hypothetical protein
MFGGDGFCLEVDAPGISRPDQISSGEVGRGMASKNPRSTVILVAVDQGGAMVEPVTLSFDDYYGESHPIIDSQAYRAERGIRQIHGEVFGMKGNLMQSFDNRYAVDGKLVGSRIVQEDGTVIES